MYINHPRKEGIAAARDYLLSRNLEKEFPNLELAAELDALGTRRASQACLYGISLEKTPTRSTIKNVLGKVLPSISL